MTDSRTDDKSIAPRRNLRGSGSRGKARPVLPPPPPELEESSGRSAAEETSPISVGNTSPTPQGTKQGKVRRTRKARLRLVHLDPWSVMKTSFLLSIAIGIVTVVAVGIVWSVLSAAGVWDSINSMVQQSVGSETGSPFRIQKYLSTSRVLGFTMIIAVVDVILITAISTLGAFLYNLSATLLGGVEVTLAEDN